jgi:hypothetical protein
MISPKTLTRCVALTLIVATSGFLSACTVYKNAHGYQNQPHVIRIETEPAGAQLRLPRHNLILVTPVDIERSMSLSDDIEITKEGYQPFRGQLRDIPQVALDTYHVKLQK